MLVALTALALLKDEQLAKHAGACVEQLTQPDASLRRAAVETLGKLSPAAGTMLSQG